MTGEELQMVKTPLPDFVRAIATEAARAVIDEHVKTCPMPARVKEVSEHAEKTSEKVTALQTKFAATLGLMVGSGTIGGTAAIGIFKLLGF